MVKEIARTTDVDDEFFANTPQNSSFRSQLAESSARIQSKPTWSVVAIGISCAFLHTDVEEDDEIECQLPTGWCSKMAR